MKLISAKRAMTLFISLIFIFAFLTTTSVAQQAVMIAGKITCSGADPKQIDVGDTDNHIISLSVSEGTNISKGENDYMDGAQVVNIGFVDLINGNGPQQGYIKHLKNGDTVFSQWQGKVTTTVTDEGIPSTTFEGTFSFIKGTGQFENIQGGGTYSGIYTSKTDYTAEWNGKYFIEKVQTPSKSESK